MKKYFGILIGLLLIAGLFVGCAMPTTFPQNAPIDYKSITIMTNEELTQKINGIYYSYETEENSWQYQITYSNEIIMYQNQLIINLLKENNGELK